MSCVFVLLARRLEKAECFKIWLTVSLFPVMQNMSVFLQVLWEDCSQQDTVGHFECSRLIVYISLCRALSYRESTLSRSPSASPSVSTPPQKEKLGKKTSVSSVAGKTAKRSPNSPAPSQRLLLPQSSLSILTLSSLPQRRPHSPSLAPPLPRSWLYT